MSGYCGYSKSNNAIDAEIGGSFPASKVARMLKVPTRFVKEHMPASGEWHHTSSHFNVTDYYHLDECRDYLESEEGQTTLTKFREQAKRLKKAGSTIYSACKIKWLEWSGSRNHPHCDEMEAAGCSVEDKGGAFVIITLPGGATFLKKKTCNGLEIEDRNGKTLFAW